VVHATAEGDSAAGFRPGAHLRPELRPDLKYNPPLSPEEVYRMEAAAVASFGFDGVHLPSPITTKYAGSLELYERRPDLNGRVASGRGTDGSLRGPCVSPSVSGLEAASAAETHARLQETARGGRLDEMFETLHATRCLVVFNHPLIPWGPGLAHSARQFSTRSFSSRRRIPLYSRA